MARTSTKSNKRFKKAKRAGRKLATVATVKRLIGKNLEHKYVDYSQAALGIYNTATVWRLNSTTQGLLDLGNRVGDSVIMKNLHVKAILRQGTTLDMTETRIIVAQIYNKPGTTPVLSDILQYTGSNDQVMCSPYRWDSKSDFKVLYDKKTVIVPVNAYGQHVEQFFNIRGRLHKKHVQYDAATANSDNEIWMFAVASNTFAQPNPTLTFTSRIVYTDA